MQILDKMEDVTSDKATMGKTEFDSCCSDTTELCDEAPCCGSPPGPPAGKDEKPGYNILNFVDSFIDIKTGRIPQVRSHLDLRDRLGGLRARLGLFRDDYRIAPGLYACGKPDNNSHVLVTANYKLSFDHLRCHLSSTDVWILVLDTRGINVWCAAGKGTFGTKELIERIQVNSLSHVVSHKKVIIPQLGATGVSAGVVRKETGFKVIWGPVRASDLPLFLEKTCKADREMRKITFNLKERAVLIPVEISLLYKYALWMLPALFILSGIGSDIFSVSAAWYRGISLLMMMLSGIIAGTCLTPLFLPWLPGVFFSVKGACAGIIAGVITTLLLNNVYGFTGFMGLMSISVVISSYLAMNFTGSTPFTSPSGVEFEMRKSIPWQLALVLAGTILWLISAFNHDWA